MGYQELDAPHFDYRLAPIDGLPDLWRGGDPRTGGPYAVCLGAAQTLGRFCRDPFPDQLSRALDLPVVNLGRGGVGPGYYLNDSFLPLVGGAEFAVVQVMSGRSVGAPDFETQWSSDQGTRTRDGRAMKAETFLREEFERLGRDGFVDLIERIQERYCERMIALLRAIPCPTVLVHIAMEEPRDGNDAKHFGGLIGSFPQLVTRPVLEQIRPAANYTVDVLSTSGIPQTLWQSESPVPGARLEDGWLLNTYYPSPEIHTEIADALTELVRSVRP